MPRSPILNADLNFENEISDETEEKLGLLKSTFLSEIIAHQKSDDFDFADYTKFDEQIENALTDPDEIWSYDAEVETYVKYFMHAGVRASQLVLMLKASKDNPLMVILSFVTRDEDLRKRFCLGRRTKISTHH